MRLCLDRADRLEQLCNVSVLHQWDFSGGSCIARRRQASTPLGPEGNGTGSVEDKTAPSLSRHTRTLSPDITHQHIIRKEKWHKMFAARSCICADRDAIRISHRNSTALTNPAPTNGISAVRAGPSPRRPCCEMHLHLALVVLCLLGVIIIALDMLNGNVHLALLVRY